MSNLSQAKIKNKIQYDKSSKELDLKVVDYVFFLKNERENSNKIFRKRFFGPYLVSRVINEQNVEIIQDKKKPAIYHKNMLKKSNNLEEDLVVD